MTNTVRSRFRVAGAFSVTGKREANEDRYGVFPAYDLAIVCDGMGGHDNGELAAELCRNSIVESVRAHPRRPLESAIVDANERVREHFAQHDQRRRPGTTVVAVRYRSNYIEVCHVGDSRAYVLRHTHGGIEYVTRDQGYGHIITQAIGLDDSLEIDSRRISGHPIVVMVTDGVTDVLSDAQIETIVHRWRRVRNRRPKEWAKLCAVDLVNTAISSNTRDNTTAVVVG